MPVSEIEWYVSESVAALPVRRKPTNSRTATTALENSAATTLLLSDIGRDYPPMTQEGGGAPTVDCRPQRRNVPRKPTAVASVMYGPACSYASG